MSSIRYLYHSLSSDTSKAYQFFQVVRFGAVLLSGMLLVKFGFASDEVSDFEWFMFLVYVFGFFWSSGFKAALSSFWPERNADEQRSLFYMLLVSYIAIAFCFSFVVWSLGLVQQSYIGVFTLFFCCSIPAVLAVHYLMLLQRSRVLFYFGIWIHVLYIMAILISYWIDPTIYSVLVGLCVWAGIKLCYTLYLVVRCGQLKIDRALYLKFISYAFPLLMYTLLGSGMDMLDGFLVKYFVDDSLFASYRYGAKELPINSILIVGLVTASVPIAVTAFDQTVADVRVRLSRYMNWMFPLAIVLLFLSPHLYTYFYSTTYLLSAQIFNVYLLILISRILTPQLLLSAMKENKVLMYISFIELFVNLSLSLFLLNSFGVLGIAYATVIAYTLEKVLQIIYLYFRKGIPLQEYVDVRKYAFFSLLLLVSYFITLYL